jgi:hypothetical protein
MPARFVVVTLALMAGVVAAQAQPQTATIMVACKAIIVKPEAC